ncbi:MAG: hypothetical protein K1X39_00290 [Thermoflexales bacterium]|nr:hypothetical protein [Thermoflexales bacterium]
MTTQAAPNPDPVVAGLNLVLTETFERVTGVYLDRGTSLFETLAGVSAATASRPLGNTSNTLAAHVRHMAFYLRVADGYVRGTDRTRKDWGAIWRAANVVTEAEWAAAIAELREGYRLAQALLADADAAKDPDWVAGATALIAHNAYHLGEIRQALGWLAESG